MALHIVRKERRLNFRPAGRVASKRHKQRRLSVVANDAHVVLEDLCIEARTAVDRRRQNDLSASMGAIVAINRVQEILVLISPDFLLVYPL